MAETIQRIPVASTGLSVNCYLILSEAGYFLIDSGLGKTQAYLAQELEQAGCRPGELKLIVLTHGDIDHVGGAAYLRERFGARVAMHRADALKVERGDMFANRQTNPLMRAIARLALAITGLGAFAAFTPDILLEDGQSLSDFGWEATVLHLPGHSKGSIGVLTAAGELLCGDEFENTKKPGVNTLGEDREQMKASAERLKEYSITMVYPGHGEPFAWSELQLAGT